MDGEVLSKEMDFTYADVVYSNHRIVESVSDKPGVLCTVEGVAMDIDLKNENDRIYSLGLVKNRIIELPYTKRMIKYKTLFGECHHPKDRNEIWFDEACISIIDIWVSEDKKHVMIRYDVLDTPKGRILKTLLDYGSVLGVSARARGKTVKRREGFVVDEKSYLFKTFDVVTNPGFMDARPANITEEQEDIVGAFKSLLESGDEQVVKKAKLFIEYSDSEELKSLLEEESESNEPEQQSNVLQDEVSRLLEENNRLKGENEILQRRVDFLIESGRQSGEDDTESLRSAFTSKLREVGRISEESVARGEEVQRLTEENKNLAAEVSRLGEELTVAWDRVGELTEENRLLQEEVEDAVSSNEEAHRLFEEALDSLEEDLTRCEVPVKRVVPVSSLVGSVTEAVLDEEVSEDRKGGVSSGNPRLEGMIKRVSGTIG